MRGRHRGRRGAGGGRGRHHGRRGGAAPRVAWRGQLGEGLARGEFADGTSRQIEGVRTGSLALVSESQPNIQRAEKRLYVLGARAGAVSRETTAWAGSAVNDL